MYFSGQHGSLFVDDEKLCAVRNWSYTVQQQVLETTSLSSTDRTIAPGVRSISGQATLFYYEDSPSNINQIASHLVATGTDGNQDSCDYGENDEPTLCKLLLRLDGASTHDVGLYAYITSFSISANVGEVVSAEVSFEGHGAPFEWTY